MDEKELIAEVLSDEPVDVEGIASGAAADHEETFQGEPLGDDKEIIPFTDEEIVNGSAIVSMMVGQPITQVKIGNDKQKAAIYMYAFKNVFGDYMPTAQLISPLKLGDALAKYGFGKGMGPGFSLENLPAPARIGLGTMMLGMSSFMAFSAVRNLEKAEKQNVHGMGDPGGRPNPDFQRHEGNQSGTATQPDTNTQPNPDTDPTT